MSKQTNARIASSEPIKVAAKKAKKPSEKAEKPSVVRLRAVNDLKRQMILEAARRVFEKDGLLKSNIRAIASEAGYTAGAIYNHYASKEEIYGDLLLQSLEQLNVVVFQDVKESLSPAKRIEKHALAFYDFYLQNPRELDLGFYFFHEMRPLGLTPELNEHLNQRLRDALSGVENGLRELGLNASAAAKETTALFGHCVGLLLLTHTGRIRMFGQDGRELFAAYVKRLVQRSAS
jgi:AcrR family transcriptional regulator